MNKTDDCTSQILRLDAGRGNLKLVGMPLRVINYNEPILREQGKKIEAFNEELEELCQEMVETMEEHEGIGLAAQQIGQALMLCVIDVPKNLENGFQLSIDGKSPPPELIMPMAMVNPKVKLLPSIETTYEEGCLSFPGINGNVKRPDKVRVSFQDAQGIPHVMECNGLLSRCVQHEVDHLNGILFIDRMEEDVLKLVEPKIRKLKKLMQKDLKKKTS